MSVTVFSVFTAAFITAIATGIGALPFLWFDHHKIKRRILGYANALAAGLMLAASFGLIMEGYRENADRTLMGMLIGVALVAIGHFFLNKKDHLQVDQIKGAGAKKSILIIAIMTIHSMAEGIGVGVAFGGGKELGVYITLAIAIHNIPEGLAIALVTVPKGMKPWKAIWWSIFSSLPQPLFAVPAYMFVRVFEPFMPVGMGIAAGAMIWMVFAEILPDSFREAESEKVSMITALSLIAMLAMQALLLPV